MGPSHLEREIHEQPHVLARLLETAREPVERLAERIRAIAPGYLLIAARGSSDNAARYAQYLFGAENRLTVALAAPALFTAYARPPRLDGAVVLAISQSGQSPDVVAVVDEGRRQGALTIALTNHPESPLGRAAEVVLALGAGDERAIAATKTYTGQVLVLAMLCAALDGDPARWAALATVPDRVTEALGSLAAARAVAHRFASVARLVVLGRGFNHATAWEIALKLKETTYVVAEPYSWADFRHGPIAIVDPGFPVLVVAPTGAVGGDVIDLCDQLAARGAELLAISDRADVLACASTRFPLAEGMPEWLSPIAAVVPGQLFALALAQARGIDPDRPRGLSKVTRTT